MSERRLDCCGLACPNPVLKTKEFIDQGDVEQVTVLVDNAAAKENVTRFLERSGYKVMVWPEGDNYAVCGFRVLRDAPEALEEQPSEGLEAEWPEPRERKILVLLGTDRLGRGDDELGRKLAINFLATLKEMGRDLWCLVLLNAGVKLAVEGSEVLDSLKELEKEGVELLVCGTCLNHFQLLDQKQVGETTNMLDIVTHMQVADKVISLT